jgi:hypothetical protein
VRVAVAQEGDLRQAMGVEGRLLAAAVTRAVRQAGAETKAIVREQVAAIRGPKVGRSVQQKNYPPGGDSANAATVVYSKAPEVFTSITTDAFVYPKNRRFMAIPTRNVPATRIGGERMSPAALEKAGYDLEPVKSRRGVLMLVAIGVRARVSRVPGVRLIAAQRGFARASKRARRTGTGLVNVVMFILVPRWRMRRWVDLESRATEGQRDLEARLAAEIAAGFVPGARQA